MSAVPHYDNADKQLPESLDVLIVGAGFGGLYQLHKLRPLGLKVKVVDAGKALGGVWYWNCYPGARVDSDVPEYEMNVEEVWKDWTWEQRFPGRNEILKYFAHIDKKLNLSKDVIFETRITGADFHAETNQWHVRTAKSEVIRAQYLILCTGFAAKAYVPPFEGAQNYVGICTHTSWWPQEGVDFKGKRAAVIGTGATGVQVIQEIGPVAGHLTVFQRTPNLCLPMRQHPVPGKETVAGVLEKRSKGFAGFSFDFMMKNTADDTPEARRAFFEKLWTRGNFEFWLAGYMDVLFSAEANKHAYDFWCEKTRARITDEKKKDLLAPIIPPHAFGTKRPCLETTYYEVMDQKNVDIINIRTNPIVRFTPKGILTADGVDHQFDVIVMATGFDAVTGSISQLDLKSTKTGEMIGNKWKNGVKTYLGISCAGYPNMFFQYGPQAPTSFSNGPPCVEAQGEWITNTIKYMTEHGKKRIEPTVEAEDKYVAHVAELFARTLFPGTDSWYQGCNIPGKKKEGLCYSGGLPSYIKELTESAEKGYEGFVIQ